ncbi:hypothetical protein SVAN01_07910 [Stagonosporopsis vannaccii]|nr:hypothetical protein SVAN01_07910 [Stagonosporopsis vannaccii]
MVRVAIAGGHRKFGPTIVEVLAEQDEYEAPVANTPVSVSVLYVDYTDVKNLTRILEENKIDTVISTIGYHGNSLEVAQMNLIHAAIASAPTQRFIPSTSAITYPRTGEALNTDKLLHDHRAPQSSSLEFNVFLNGCSLDYWGVPRIETYPSPAPFAVDIQNRRAAIPGDGEARVTFTYSYDAAQFRVSLLGDEQWEEDVFGEPFEVVYDSFGYLEQGRTTELSCQIECDGMFPKPPFQSCMSIFWRWTAEERMSFVEGTLNRKFPNI